MDDDNIPRISAEQLIAETPVLGGWQKLPLDRLDAAATLVSTPAGVR